MGADKQSITFWRWNRTIKIITAWGYRFVAPSSSSRRIRQKFDPARCFVISRSPNPSKYVKICQNMSIFVFWRYMQNDRFVICHCSSFTLAVWERVVCSGGAWFAGQILGAHCRDQVIIIAFQILLIPLTIKSLHERAIVNYVSLNFPMHDWFWPYCFRYNSED